MKFLRKLLGKSKIKEDSGNELIKSVINSKESVTIKVKIEDQYILVYGVIPTYDNNRIEYKSYRDLKLCNGNPAFTFTYLINDFVEEIKFIANYLDKNGLNDKNLDKSIEILATKHINKNGRMIDSDLYGIIDRAVILKTCIAEHYNQRFSDKQLEAIWLMLLRPVLLKVKDYFYETKFDMSNPSFPKPYLKKLLD